MKPLLFTAVLRIIGYTLVTSVHLIINVYQLNAQLMKRLCLSHECCRPAVIIYYLLKGNGVYILGSYISQLPLVLGCKSEDRNVLISKYSQTHNCVMYYLPKGSVYILFWH